MSYPKYLILRQQIKPEINCMENCKMHEVGKESKMKKKNNPFIYGNAKTNTS